MVVERNPGDSLRNGRSRGPSPNGHAAPSPDSSDDDSTKKTGNKNAAKTKSEYEEKIRVGKDYQTVCPDLIPVTDRRPETLNDRALLVWSPTNDIPDNKLEEYIAVAKEKYGYNGEQALGMLFWHKHDLERAVLDLANFTPFPDEWTDEDKVLFEQAFQFHGKSFHRIRQMLPDKTIASLVKYYYSWKKTRSRTSVMDRQEKIKLKDGSENGSENGSNEDSDAEDKQKWPLHRGIRRASGSPPPRSGVADKANNSGVSTSKQTTNATVNGNANGGKDGNGDDDRTISAQLSGCYGCGVACNHTNASPHGALCNSCFHHWSRTGSLRPTSGPSYGKRSRGANNGMERHKRKPPRGIYINHDDIVALACPDQANRSDDLLASMDREISSLMSQIQGNKQIVSSLKRKSTEEVDDLYQADNSNRLNSRWNNDELQLAAKGVRKYGKDFQAIAEMLGTKTESQVRTFYLNYRRKYNLDAMLEEYEKNIRAQSQEGSGDEEAVDGDGHAGSCEDATESVAENQLTINDAANTAKQSDDDIMEIDLDDDIPNGKEDDDVEEVTIIENTVPTIMAGE